MSILSLTVNGILIWFELGTFWAGNIVEEVKLWRELMNQAISEIQH